MNNKTENTLNSTNKHSKTKLEWFNKHSLLKTLLFSMIFYILVSPLIAVYIKKIIPFQIEIQVIQAFLFGIIFYIITINDL